MDVPRYYQIKWRKSKTNTISYDISYMWIVKKKKNELIYKTEIDPQT